MEEQEDKRTEHIRSFTQLHVWQEGHVLVLAVHKCLKEFPIHQQYGLSNQMSRASIFVTSNIAEGFGRLSYKEKIQFYYIAQGSLIELQNQLLITRDIGYLTANTFNQLAKQTVIVHKLLTGFIKSARRIQHTT